MEVNLDGLDDHREFERQRRENYNLDSASDAAIIASIRHILQGMELPNWAANELYAPIPAGANRQLIQQAENKARDAISSEIDVDDEKLIQEVLDLTLRNGEFESLREAQ
jgi:hypothetical protein